MTASIIPSRWAVITPCRAMSGPGCSWRVYETHREHLAIPSADDWTAWREDRSHASLEAAEVACTAKGVRYEVRGV